MGEAPDTALGAFLAGLEAFARAQRRAAEALFDDGPAADAAWTAALGAFERWRSAARRAAARAGSAPGAETLARMLDPAQWLFSGGEALDPTLKALLDGPSRAELAQFGRAGLDETREWRALLDAKRAHRALVAGAWSRALERLQGRAARLAESDPVEAHRLWTEIAGAELDRLHQDEAFAASQARLINAAVALRGAEIALVERFCEARGLPTRREVDDLHEAVAELRRELRVLKARR